MNTVPSLKNFLGVFTTTVVLLLLGTAKAQQIKPEAIIPEFQKRWKDHRGYMRPSDDTGWQARMLALQRLAGLRSGAVPVLEKALAADDVETRILAAHALYYLADPKSKPLLQKALEDNNPVVRLYSIDSLSTFGKLSPNDRYLKIKNGDRNRDVRSHMRFALSREDTPNPQAIRKELLSYDLKKMNTAKLKQSAPEFAMTGALGKTWKLSKFRGKKAVVLIFIYGDT